jgi:hypothetical protein
MIPMFFTEGITYRKAKTKRTADPSNYRPITSLPILYKLMTSVISEKFSQHLEINNVLTEEEKECSDVKSK